MTGPYDYDHEFYQVDKPHLRGQSLRRWRWRLRGHLADLAAGSVIILGFLVILFVESGVMRAETAMKGFVAFMVVGALWFFADLTTDMARQWKARGKR